MQIQEAVSRLLEAKLDEAEAKARADTLKRHLEKIALKRWRDDSTIQRWTDASGMGDVRLDNAGKPAKITVTDPAAFADHVAQHTPDAVVATITVPAGRLADALDALAFSGIDGVTAAVAPKDTESTDSWLAANTRVLKLDQNRLVVQQVKDGDDGTRVVVAAEVPGITAVPTQPHLYVAPDKALKVARTSEAVTSLMAELDAPAEPVALTVVPSPPASDPAPEPVAESGRATA